MWSALRHPGFRNLFLANLLSQIGSKIHRVALLFVGYSVTGNAVGVSVILAGQFLSSALLGPILGPLVDRYDRRSIMVFADAARVLLVALIPLFALKSLPLLVVLSLLIALFEAVYFPAKNSAIPDLVPEQDLDNANALVAAAERISEVGFVALAGVLVATVGPIPAFWIDAVSYLLSTLFLMGIPKLAGKSEKGGYLQAIRAGIQPLLSNPILRKIIGTFAVAAMFGSVEAALGIVLAVGTLKIGVQGFGALEALQALGLLVGLGLVGTVLKRYSREQTFLLSLFAFGIVTISIGLLPYTPWIVVAFFLTMVLNAFFLIPARTIVQKNAPTELRGRIFAAYRAIMDGAVLVGTILAGILEPHMGVLNVYILSGICVALVTGWVILRGGIPESQPQEATAHQQVQ